MAQPLREVRPLLLIISDRPFVWVGFRAPGRDVRRWIGERETDEERASPNNFGGDPTDPGTYRWTGQSPDLSAVVDLQDQQRAAGAIDALRRTRPEAAVLVITADDELEAPDIAVSRRLAWTDALRGDLEGELRQLEALRRLKELREFADADGDVAIAVHADPDPDALASALGLRVLLRRDAVSAPIITLGDITRPENRRMVELLHLRVTKVTPEEMQKLPRVIAVDFQPAMDALPAEHLAIIDHHPGDATPAARFVDVRPRYGATATMLTEYLRLDDEQRIGDSIATALLYGIKTDTDALARGCIAADVEAYAFLQGCADLTLLRLLERPSYAPETARRYGAALQQLAVDDDIAVAFLGEVDEADAHVLAELADFCLGLHTTTWAAAAAVIDDRLTLSIRHLGGQPGAGDLARLLATGCGEGGGHATMARAVIPVTGSWNLVIAGDCGEVAARLLALLRDQLRRGSVSPRSSRPARPAKVPSAKP